MAALDTNVLVRWLVNDNSQQCDAISLVLSSAVAKDERLFVAITVLLETEWVLRSRYEFDKNSVIGALDALLSVSEFEFQHEPALEQALWNFKGAGAPDFADCLHVALVGQAGRGPLLTFDKKASKLANVLLLG